MLNWSKVSSSKDNGGLGLTALRIKNKAMLGKWRARWISDRDSSWNKYVKAKYMCSLGTELGEALGSKKTSDILSGILKVNGIDGFDSKLKKENFKLNHYEW